MNQNALGWISVFNEEVGILFIGSQDALKSLIPLHSLDHHLLSLCDSEFDFSNSLREVQEGSGVKVLLVRIQQRLKQNELKNFKIKYLPDPKRSSCYHA